MASRGFAVGFSERRQRVLGGLDEEVDVRLRVRGRDEGDLELRRLQVHPPVEHAVEETGVERRVAGLGAGQVAHGERVGGEGGEDRGVALDAERHAMARGGKNRISGFASTSFKDEYGALSIGFDRKFASNWIAGAVFEAIEGDQTVRSNGYKAEGESSTQALKGYLSWFGEKGSYADVVFGVSYFDQDINTKMLDGTGVSGGFSGWGWGASVEVGHQFLMDSDPTWFIEPQVQLSYFRVQGDSFALTNAMRVDQEDADSLTGRLGLVVGRTILTDSGSGWQFSVKGGLSHEFLDEADIHVNGERFTGSTLGTRGYYGVAFDWYASDDVRVFGQIEREEGAHYTSEINARIGVKYCF